MAVWCRKATGVLVLLNLCTMPGASLLAQKSDVYTLPMLVDSASKNLPVLLQKQALVRSAEAGITEARHTFLPKVNLAEGIAMGSSNDLAGPYMPGSMHPVSGSITGQNDYQAAAGNIASLYAEYELVNFGLRGAKVASARAFADVQRADLTREQYVVKWQIAKLYLNISRVRYQLAVDREDIRRYESMLAVTQALTSTGINAGVDSSLAKAGLSRARVKYNQREGELRRLTQQMTYYTGIVQPAIADSDTTGLAATDATRIPGSSNANPLADYYQRQQLQYRSEMTLIRKSYLPKILLGAGGWARGSSIQFNNDYKGLGEGFGFQRLNYLAGLGISYDLFNGVRKRDRMAVINQQAVAADYALEQQELVLRNAAAQAEEDMRTARRNLDELPVQLQAARDAYNQKMAQYQAGIIDLVDLTNAAFVLYQAQTELIETRNGWFIAGLDKAAATGGLDLFIQTIQ